MIYLVTNIHGNDFYVQANTPKEIIAHLTECGLKDWTGVNIIQIHAYKISELVKPGDFNKGGGKYVAPLR